MDVERDSRLAAAPVLRGEYVIGYRRLRLLGGGRLEHGRRAVRAWARDLASGGPHGHLSWWHHDAPDPDCSCGLYALHEPPPASCSYVLAAVRGWGAVEVHPSGWRAEDARIVDPMLPAARRQWPTTSRAPACRQLIPRQSGRKCTTPWRTSTTSP